MFRHGDARVVDSKPGPRTSQVTSGGHLVLTATLGAEAEDL